MARLPADRRTAAGLLLVGDAVVITNNVIEANDGDGAEITGGLFPVDAETGVSDRLSGNVVRSNGEAAFELEAGIYPAADFWEGTDRRSLHHPALPHRDPGHR